MLFSVFWVFFKLGWVAFGGPMAHIAWFRRRFVALDGWLKDEDFTSLLALCQFLPGPASSQLGMAIGYRRAGVVGSIAAFVGFTLPSAALMILAAVLLSRGELQPTTAAALHGLKLFAVIVVADAIWGMAKNHCDTRIRMAIALVSAIVVLLLPGMTSQLGVIMAGAVAGALLLPKAAKSEAGAGLPGIKSVLLPGVLFLLGLFVLPLVPMGNAYVSLFEAFFRVGALVFGGGHVVLPLLQGEALVQQGMSQTQFLTGYSLAQAVPGPMFTLTAYLGTVLGDGALGGVVALLAVFLPGWLLLLAILPCWSWVQGQPRLMTAMLGVTSATVGLLLAALYQPVWVSAIRGPADVAVVLAGWFFLIRCRTPVWIMAPAMAGVGVLLGAL